MCKCIYFIHKTEFYFLKKKKWKPWDWIILMVSSVPKNVSDSNTWGAKEEKEKLTIVFSM